MTKLEQIEKQIAELSPEDRAKLAAWLAESQANEWDRRIEADAKAGRLDRFVDEAKREIGEGKIRSL